VKWPTKIKPAPLAFPNGGGLKAMNKGSKVKEQEIRVAEEQHKLKLAQIDEKYKAKSATPKKAK
jgi:hypothetical protein